MELQGPEISFLDMIEKAPKGSSEIAEFYAGATVFVTGGTGFLGKLIIEKLLRSCPGIKKIYVLIRPKKGKDINARFQAIFTEPIFVHVMQNRVDSPEKVELIAGDCGKLGLEISEEDKIKLQNEVTVVFHGAATVRFDEKLKNAIDINARGTRELMVLAKTFKNLQSLVHVSTAYSHCPRHEIDEKFYDVPFNVDKLIDLVDCIDETNLENFTPALLYPWPNTYAYTKAVAEEVVRTYGKGMPVAIVRPSIVTGTAREPLAGWIDNVYGPTGVIIGVAAGLLRTLHCDSDGIADIVPADYVVNALITVAWDVVKDRNSNLNFEMEPKIFNYVSCSQNPLTWGNFMEFTSKHGTDIPLSRTIWYQDCFTYSKTKLSYDIRSFFWHTIPALLIDMILRLIGRKPMLMEAYRKVKKFNGIVTYFSTRHWTFTNENTQQLTKKQSMSDRETFNFDISHLVWDDLASSCLRGGRLYLMKDKPETIPYARVRMGRLKIAHYTLKALLWFGMFYLLYKFLSLFSMFTP